jgi:protein-arginine deiminase
VQRKFVADLQVAITGTGVNKPLFLFSGSDDVWAQDIVEPGYTSMPGPDGLITLQVMVRSAQPSRVAGRQVFEYLRTTGRGAVYGFVGIRDEVNSMGNLETIPPYTLRENSYPAGRVIQGAHGPLEPHIYDYMRAQEVQDPLILDLLILDADWLAVGHVDEFIQFLPAKNSRHGWVLFVADPVGGIEILKKAVRDGHGDVPAFSRKNATRPPFGPPDAYVPGGSISELLAIPEFVKKNDMFTERIERVREVLQQETGIPDSDIYKVPSVFETGVCSGPDEGISPERNCSENHGAALYPGVINGLVLSDTEYLSPNPWGPVIGGVDIMVEATNEVYGRIGYHVTYIDDWYSHHVGGGEVHCGSNSIRTVSVPWWRNIHLEDFRQDKGRHDEL